MRFFMLDQQDVAVDAVTEIMAWCNNGESRQ